MVFNVKITASSFPYIWYEKCLGKIYECQDFDEHFYQVVGSNRVVLKEDGEIVCNPH